MTSHDLPELWCAHRSVQDALNVDIALNPGSQSVAVGLRAEGALAGRVPLHAIIVRLKEEILAIVQELQ